MSNKFNKGKEFFSEKLDIPKEVVLDVPRIIIIGKDEITVENHKGILTFERDKIKVNTGIGAITIRGKNFEILYIAASTITISGIFNSVAYEG